MSNVQCPMSNVEIDHSVLDIGDLSGHGFEGKPPEFLKDWRFLFVGLRWWVAKLRGRVPPGRA
jgi:hypothetical protein